MRPHPTTLSARRRVAGDHRRERALALVAGAAAARATAGVLDDLEAAASRPRLVLVPAPLASVTELAQRRSS